MGDKDVRDAEVGLEDWQDFGVVGWDAEGKRNSLLGNGLVDSSNLLV